MTPTDGWKRVVDKCRVNEQKSLFVCAPFLHQWWRMVTTNKCLSQTNGLIQSSAPVLCCYTLRVGGNCKAFSKVASTSIVAYTRCALPVHVLACSLVSATNETTFLVTDQHWLFPLNPVRETSGASAYADGHRWVVTNYCQGSACRVFLGVTAKPLPCSWLVEIVRLAFCRPLKRLMPSILEEEDIGIDFPLMIEIILTMRILFQPVYHASKCMVCTALRN